MAKVDNLHIPDLPMLHFPQKFDTEQKIQLSCYLSCTVAPQSFEQFLFWKLISFSLWYHGKTINISQCFGSYISRYAEIKKHRVLAKSSLITVPTSQRAARSGSGSKDRQVLTEEAIGSAAKPPHSPLFVTLSHTVFRRLLSSSAQIGLHSHCDTRFEFSRKKFCLSEHTFAT